jgi:hypothetical protein
VRIIETDDFVFRNKANFVIDLTWVGKGTHPKDSKDSRNKWHLKPNGSRVVPMAVNVRHKFFMINSQSIQVGTSIFLVLIQKIFSRLFQDDAIVHF